MLTMQDTLKAEGGELAMGLPGISIPGRWKNKGRGPRRKHGWCVQRKAVRPVGLSRVREKSGRR